MQDHDEFARLAGQYIDTVYRVAYGYLRSAAGYGAHPACQGPGAAETYVAGTGGTAMTDRQKFHETFDALQAPDGLLDAVLERTAVPRKRKHRGMRVVIVLAVLTVVLSVTAIAQEQIKALRTRQDMAEQCTTELQTLHDLGLFLPDLYFSADDCLPDIPANNTTAYILPDAHADDDPFYFVSLRLRPDTMKILWLSINGSDPIAADMTIGDYCDIWKTYHGYARYELPEGVSPDVLILEASKLEVWKDGISSDYFHSYENGLMIQFYSAATNASDTMYLSGNKTESGIRLLLGLII